MEEYKKFNIKIINYINVHSRKVIFNLVNTKSINFNRLNLIKNPQRIYFHVNGGLNKKKYLTEKYIKRVTYSYNEIVKIINELNKYDNYIKIENEKERALIVYKKIRELIKYSPNINNDKKIRSLLCLSEKIAVCSGYSLIFKELMDRLNIKCKYVQKNNHVWNNIYLNKKWYDIDLTWDSCVYHKTNTPLVHYFGNYLHLHDCKEYSYFDNLEINNAREISVHTLKRNDGSVFIISQLSFGKLINYYAIYEDNALNILLSENNLDIIISQNDDALLECFINSLLAKKRIKNKNKNNYSYVGYGQIIDNCYYRKKNKIIVPKIIKIDNKSYNLFSDYILTFDNEFKIKIEVIKC